MKKIFTLLLSATTALAQAQPMLSNGFGSLAAINGNTYQKTGTIGTGNYGCVSASANGVLFFATGANATSDKLYFINVTASSIIDSMTLPSGGGELASSNEPDTLFNLRGTSLYRINTMAKTADSIIIGNPNRLQERPNAKEVWVAADSMIYVVNYAAAMTFTTIDLSSNKFDNSDIRFTKGGSMAYKAAASNKKVYKIDGASKAVVDSFNTAPYGAVSVEISSDSSKLFTANGGKVIYIYSVATKALTDSIVTDKQVMNLYINPAKPELWSVHHFSDSASVFNETSKAKLASFDIGNDPFFLAFSTGTVGINSLARNNYALTLYPNPAARQLTVTMPGNIKHDIVIYNYAGSHIANYSINNTTITFSVADLAAGGYYIAVYEDGELKKTTTFLKE